MDTGSMTLLVEGIPTTLRYQEGYSFYTAHHGLTDLKVTEAARKTLALNESSPSPIEYVSDFLNTWLAGMAREVRK